MHDVIVLKDVPGRLDSALERGRVHNVDIEVLFLDLSSRAVRLGNTRRRKGHVNPAGETVLDVPLALAVADEDEGMDLRNTKQ